MQIKGAIFDMDGTLVDSLGFWEDVWAHFGALYHGDASFYPGKDVENAVRTATLEEAGVILHQRAGFGNSAEQFAPELLEFLCHLYRTKLQPKPGAQEYLRALSEQGVRMCIASASPMPLIRLGLEKCEIRQYFDRVISCDEVGKGKTAPDVFFAALRYLGTEQNDTWVFEDSPVALTTAQRAGFRTVGVFDRHTAQKAVRASSTEYVGEGETFLRLL